MSFFKINDAKSIRSLLVISGLSPMATRHSRLWLKMKWRKRQQIETA